MGALTVVKNKTLLVDPSFDALDTGWTISGVYATHTACNPGTIVSKTPLGLVVGKTYVISYTIDNYFSGSVYALLGSTQGAAVYAAGTVTQTIQCAGSASLSFYSNGALRITLVSFYEYVQQPDNSVTVSFNEKNNLWGSEYDFKPEIMLKFIDKFFAFKDGQPWLQNSNETRNNFFGVQYVSKVRFYDNINPTTQKIYFSIRVQGNRVWFCPADGDILIPPTDGRIAGMSSRLKKGNFKNYQGSYFADFLRNTLDPTFSDNLLALFRAEPLRGRYLDITLTNDDTIEAILFEVDVKSSASQFTY